MERAYRRMAAAACFLATLAPIALAPGVEAATAQKLTVHVEGIRNNKHVLAKGEIVGTYTQNLALMMKSKTAKKAS
jgi:uncharacterized protein (DUF2141 family)